MTEPQNFLRDTNDEIVANADGDYYLADCGFFKLDDDGRALLDDDGQPIPVDTDDSGPIEPDDEVEKPKPTPDPVDHRDEDVTAPILDPAAPNDITSPIVDPNLVAPNEAFAKNATTTAATISNAIAASRSAKVGSTVPEKNVGASPE